MFGSKGLTLVKLFSVFTLKDGEIDLKLLTNVLSPETEVFEVGHNSHVFTLLVYNKVNSVRPKYK